MANIRIYDGQILADGGHIASDAACCCDYFPPDCDCYPEGESPDIATVTISGVTSCPEYWGKCSCSEANGTFVLDDKIVSLDSCDGHFTWQYNYVASGADRYVSFSCDNGTWYLTASCRTIDPSGFTKYCFQDVVITMNENHTYGTCNNRFTTSDDCYTGVVAGYGGSATITLT